MTIVEKVPSMSDQHLVNLRANAQRMQATGAAQQQASAGEVLAAVDSELALRRAAHLEALAAKRAAAPKRVKKVKEAVVEG
jgi:hypothetical protein